MTITTTDLANVPYPAGACEIDSWINPGTPEAKRYFVGSRWVVSRSPQP
jgi:hypothetical protein